jgi:hypothetical protein
MRNEKAVPPLRRRLAGSSAISAALAAPPVPPTVPRAPRNAPVPPTIAQFPRSLEGIPGGAGPPLRPTLMIVAIGVPSGCRISKRCSRRAVRVRDAAHFSKMARRADRPEALTGSVRRA